MFSMGLTTIRRPAENYLANIAEFLTSLDSPGTLAQIVDTGESNARANAPMQTESTENVTPPWLGYSSNCCVLVFLLCGCCQSSGRKGRPNSLSGETRIGGL